MTWWNSSWTRRAPVALDHLIAGVVAEDYTITIPPGHEEFWSTVKADGGDIRVINSMGLVELSYKLNTWTYASRVAIVELDNVTPPAANSIHVVYIYWGNAAAATTASVFVAAAPRNGYVHPGNIGYPVIPVRNAGFKQLRPPTRLAKCSGETHHLWFDVSQILEKYRVAYNSHLVYEGIVYLQLQVLKAGAEQAGEHDDTEIRVIDPGYIRTTWKAGTDAEDRTISLIIATTLGRLFNPRAWAAVRNTDEA